MAFADPQSITISTIAHSMPRVQTGTRAATYQKNDGTHILNISHTTVKPKGERNIRNRGLFKFTKTVVAADPLTAEQTSQHADMYLVIDRPLFGFSQSDIEAIWAGFKDALNAAGVIGKIYGGES